MNEEADRVRAALDAGRPEEAARLARLALATRPDAETYALLSAALRGLDRPEEAVAAASNALALSDDHLVARVQRGLALNQLGRSEEALRDFDFVVAQGGRASWILFARGAAQAALGRDADAEASYRDGLKRAPADRDLHVALANLRWQRGDGEPFTHDMEAAIAQRPDDAALRTACADLVRRAGYSVKAEALLRAGLARHPDHVATLAVLGTMLMELDRGGEAAPMLERALSLSPQSRGVRAAYTATLLRLERPHEALPQIETALAARPYDQESLAYQSLAFRQLGDDRYRWLCDYEHMVQAYDLPAPAGYADAKAFNEALAARLNALHVRTAHPLDQTLRGGSQTTRPLTTSDDAIIQTYLAALDEPIRAYMDLMRDPAHPWSGRKTGAYKLAGAWSVKLRADGYHVNHVHPDGWISSAYYVAVPEQTASGHGQEGWIKFGEPRWPTPGCGVEKVIQPQAGRLVLFPSYMWHGTIAFGEGERLTAPFDVVPV